MYVRKRSTRRTRRVNYKPYKYISRRKNVRRKPVYSKYRKRFKPYVRKRR